MTSPLPTESAYFPGEFLTVGDYAEEQSYQIAMQRRGAAALSTWGITQGLDIQQPSGGPELVVEAGAAIDGLGRLLVMANARSVAVPPASLGLALLTATYAEVAAAVADGAASYITETVELAWYPQAEEFDRTLHLVLGQYSQGAPGAFSPQGRRYAGAMAGTVELLNPLNPARPAITGWSSAEGIGLRVNAPLTVLSAFPGSQPLGGATLSVIGGALGIGTMSPVATLDTLGSNVAQAGPGRLTSFGVLVRGDSVDLTKVIHVGDVLMVTDRQGVARQSPVAQVLESGDVLTATPLNCEDAPFQFQRALVASIRDAAGEPALNIDRQGRSGFGVEFPQSRLHVGQGDLDLTGQGRVIAFDGDAQVETLDGVSRLAFLSEPSRLEVHQEGDIHWLPGRASSPIPVGMALTAAGRVGIGTLSPEASLDVEGYIYSEQGGFIFPDGSTQMTAEVSVPVGTVIDWWRGDTDMQPPLNYQICDGSIVTDKSSVFYGKATPNLADLFTVGVATVSDVGQISGDNQHLHSYTTPTHNHPMSHSHPPITGEETGQATDSQGMAGTSDNNAQSHHKHQFNATAGPPSELDTGSNSDAGTAAQTGEASLVPPFLGLLKLIRIT